MKRELLERAPYGSFQDRFELYENFSRIPRLVSTPRTLAQAIAFEYLASSVDKRIFTAPWPCKVRKADLTVTVAGTDASAVSLMLKKVPSGTAIGAGSDMLSAAFDLKGTADTIQNGSLHATAANTELAAGNSIGLDFTGALTAATGAGSVLLEALPANEDWVISGTNAADANVTQNADGGLSIATAGANNDQVIVSPRDALASVAASLFRTVEWEPEHEVQVEAIFEFPAVTALRFHLGLGLTSVLDLTTDADQAKLAFDTGGAVSTSKWTANTSIAGTDAEATTGVALAVDLSVRLGIRISSTRIPRFYVNGVKAHTGGALTAGVNLVPYFGVQALAAAAKTFKVRGLRVSRVLTVTS